MMMLLVAVGTNPLSPINKFVILRGCVNSKFWSTMNLPGGRHGTKETPGHKDLA